jgi:TfdA family taurine catabolism dioxygenase TauD
VQRFDHDELARESEEIRLALAARGYVHLKGERSFERFEELAARLGTIKLRSDVISDPTRDAEQRRTRTFGPHRPGTYTAGELDFHSDNPTWNVLGFYCAAQDEHSGSNLLLDLAHVSRSFTQEELAALCQVKIYLPLRDANGQEIAAEVPLLTETRGGYDVYWVPWLVVESCEAAYSELLNRFRAWIRHQEETGLIELRLEPGECLLIHNNRMLHGRRKLKSDTRRHLIRLAIAADNLRAG